MTNVRFRFSVGAVQFPIVADGGAVADLHLRLHSLHFPFTSGSEQDRASGYLLEGGQGRRAQEPVGGSQLRPHGGQHFVLFLDKLKYNFWY